MITIANLAARFGVSEITAYRWVQRGLVPGVVRVGHTIRIDAGQLEGFIQQGGQPWTKRARRTRPT